MFSQILIRILLLAAALSPFCSAHNIQLGAHSRECFHESLRKDDKMTVTFQVGDREFGGSGNIEIDFWVCFGPSFNKTCWVSQPGSHAGS